MKDFDISINPIAVLDLSDVLIRDDSEYPFTFFPTGLISSAEIIHNRTGSRGKIKAYNPDFAYLDVDWGKNDCDLYHQIRIDRPEVDGFSISMPSSELDESLDLSLDGRGWILGNGRVISTHNGPHWEKRHLVKGEESAIRYNFGHERYVDLPKGRPSDCQFETLSKLMDYFFVPGNDVGIRSTPVEIDLTSKGKRFPISPGECGVDEAIGLMKRLYVMEESEGPKQSERGLDVTLSAQSSNAETTPQAYMDKIERQLLEKGYTDIEFKTEISPSRTFAEWYYDKDILKLTFNGKEHRGVEMVVDGDGWGVRITDKSNDVEYRSMESLEREEGILTDDDYFQYLDEGERAGTIDSEMTNCYISVYYKDAGGYEYFDMEESILTLGDLWTFLQDTDWIDSYLTDNAPNIRRLANESLDVAVTDPRGDSDSYMRSLVEKLKGAGYDQIEFHVPMYPNRQKAEWYVEDDASIDGTRILTAKYEVEGEGVLDVEVCCNGFMHIRREDDDSLYTVPQLQAAGIMNDDDFDRLLDPDGEAAVDAGNICMFTLWTSVPGSNVAEVVENVTLFSRMISFMTDDDVTGMHSLATWILQRDRERKGIHEGLDVGINPSIQQDDFYSSEDAVRILEKAGYSDIQVHTEVEPSKQYAEFYSYLKGTETVMLTCKRSVEGGGKVLLSVCAPYRFLFIVPVRQNGDKLYLKNAYDLMHMGVETDDQLEDMLRKPGADVRMRGRFNLMGDFFGRMGYGYRFIDSFVAFSGRFSSIINEMASKEMIEKLEKEIGGGQRGLGEKLDVSLSRDDFSDR